ncbi:MAG TPA: carboxypeptidase regulatory-like domain-containing protein, partial [bacterium]|nr:carboxypeptidase regulatory-like domain-containing protein [bacterium]
SGYVLAGLDVDASRGSRDDLELIAPQRPCLRGSLRDSAGDPLPGWHVLAVPEVGTAAHRMFRRREAKTGPDGSFSVPAVDAREPYQLGFYPPDRWWPHPLRWPVALARGSATSPLHLCVDTGSPPRARLACRAIGPDGRPCRGATFELRHTAFQAPLTATADGGGAAGFADLPAGDYWLVVRAQGLGSRTFEVSIPDDDAVVDLGAVQIERPVQLLVRCTGGSKRPAAGVRVVARPVVGDKFVSARTDGSGSARLAPIPPGRTRLTVYGPGVVPRLLERELEPGVQWIDVDLEPAPTQVLAFAFQEADNPFVVNGPLHVTVCDGEGRPVLDDYLGAVASSGRFECRTGLRPGRYQVRARSLWNALAVGECTVQPATGAAPNGGTVTEFVLRP